MSRRNRKRAVPDSAVAERGGVACAENAIVRYVAAESGSPSVGGIFRSLEPWTVDESVCGDHPLPPHEAIEARAREIWEMRGKPAGADLDIWLEAQGQFVSAMR